MDLVKRNAEIVALVKARKMPMRKIAARYRLSTSSISLIAIRHGVHAQAADPKKVRAASKLIQRGMPLRHVAQTVGLGYQRLRHLLEKQGVYKAPPPNRPWSAREVRVLRQDYGKPGCSLRTIAAKIGRTCQAVNLKAALLGLSGRSNSGHRQKGRPSSVIVSRPRHSGAWPPARAAAPSPGLSTCDTPPSRGWQGSRIYRSKRSRQAQRCTASISRGWGQFDCERAMCVWHGSYPLPPGIRPSGHRCRSYASMVSVSASNSRSSGLFSVQPTNSSARATSRACILSVTWKGVSPRL